MTSPAPRRALAASLTLAVLLVPAIGGSADAQRRREGSTTRAQQQARLPQLSGTFYRNCNEARAAGAAPLYRGQPGYRPQMDGDNDGVACEPYRGRR